MPLSRPVFVKYCSELPAVTLHEQWGSLVAKVGGKVFALRGETEGGIVFKVTELGFEGLTSMEGIGQAAYFAKGQWVNVTPDAALPAKDAKAYVAASHAMVASKLTRKLRLELGLDDALR